MKKVGIIIISCILAVGLFATFIFTSASALENFYEDGYGISSNADLARSLINEDGTSKELIKIEQDQPIIKWLGEFYVNEKREKIDSSFPIYVHNNTAVRFLDEDKYLISNDLDIETSFEGLYLSNGTTYNANNTQADLLEFILIRLNNGLYINAQPAKFKSQLENVDIPTNSILKFTEDSLKWYEPNGEIMSYSMGHNTIGTTLTIGNNEYKYSELLEALNLVNSAIDKKEDDEEYEEDLEEAREVIGHDGGTGGGKGAPGDGGKDDGDGGAGVSDSDNQNGGDADGDAEGSGKQETSGDGGNQSDGDGDVSDDEPGTDEGDEETDDDSEEGTGSGSKAGDSDHEGGGEVVDPTPHEHPDKKFYYPEVTLSHIDPWAYALHGDLSIVDKSSSLANGVTVTAYRSIKKTGDVVKGRSAIYRTTKKDSSEITMSILPPNSTIYLQYTYVYYVPTMMDVEEKLRDENGKYIRDENGQIKTEIVNKEVKVPYEYSSDLVPYKTKGIDEVYTINMNLEETFASSSNAFSFNNIKLENSSDYNAEITTWDEFKKNTLPYVSRIQFEFTPKNGGDTFSIFAGRGTINDAINTVGSFNASSGLIKSNSIYDYKVYLNDKFGNKIPMNIGDGYTGTLYTQKTMPTVSLDSSEENSMEKVIYKIKVNDPNDALLKGEDGKTLPLKFYIADKQGINQILEGTLDGEEVASGDEEYIYLKNPEHNKTYTFVITSLLLEQGYNVSVIGDINLNPDIIPEGVTPKDISYNVQIGKGNLYTASPDTGKIAFTGIPTDVGDTFVNYTLQMNHQTTEDILFIISEYRIYFHGKDKNSATVPEDYIFYRDELENMIVEESNYDTKNGWVELQKPVEATYDADGNLTSQAKMGVYLSGLITDMAGHSVWDLIQIEGERDAVQIIIKVPANTLETSTNYLINIESSFWKRHHTKQYTIFTDLPSNQFKTRKTAPKIVNPSFFAAGNVAELQGFKVVDIDRTILDQKGEVQLNLYIKGSNKLIDVISFDAVEDPDAEGGTYRFNDLIVGVEYYIDVTATKYKDADSASSYKENKSLGVISFTAGSLLYANLTLDSNKKNADGTYNIGASIEGKDYKNYLSLDNNFYVRVTRSETYTVTDYNEIYLGFSEDGIEEYPLVNIGTETLDEEVYENVFGVEGTISLDNVPSDSSYLIEAYCMYAGKEFTLSQVEIKTDQEYILVTNNKELNDAISKYPKGNILVVSDFEHNISAPSKTFSGTIDFGGHTITRALNNYGPLIYTLAGTGVVKNIHYVIPEEWNVPRSTTSSSINSDIVYEVVGTLENFILRFKGETNVYTPQVASGYTYQSFICRTCSGTIRNFAVAIEGNLNFIQSQDTYATFSFMTIGPNSLTSTGLIENGAIYSLNGASISFQREMNIYNLCGGLTCKTGGGGTGNSSSGLIRNIYVNSDIWFSETGYSTNYEYVSIFGDSRVQNVYMVGDYYKCTAGKPLDLSTPLLSERLCGAASAKGVTDTLWHITSAQYNSTTTKYSPAAQLLDSEWHKSVLGDGFIIDRVVPRYFPRVNMSDEMMKHLDYVDIAKLGSDAVPSVVSDSYAIGDDYIREDDRAHILLRFKNDRGQTIESVTIDGLDVLGISNIGRQSDGLYDVILLVQVRKDKDASYVNSYKVSGFTYLNGVKKYPVTTQYMTKNISFWKDIETYEDWININGFSMMENGKNVDVPYSKTKTWNYRIVKDIDFEGKDPKAFVINGNKNSMTSGTAFTGVIDGGIYDNGVLTGMHTISNITIPNINSTNAGLIPTLTGGSIKNLIVDNFNITASSSGSITYMGLVGNYTGAGTATYGGIDNVHLLNSYCEGKGIVGMLVGYANEVYIVNSSLQNCTLRDVAAKTSSTFGGMVGYGNGLRTVIENSYIRNIDISVENSLSLVAVGGFIGQASSTAVNSCYITGNIRAVGDYIGGIYGINSSSTTTYSSTQCYTKVDMDVTGSNVYGLGMNSTYSGRGYSSSIALGNIIASGTAGRTFNIARKSTGTTNGTYAYSGQTVNALSRTDLDSAVELFNGVQLTSRSTWIDKVKIGNQFDLSYIADGYCPPVYMKNSTSLVYGQLEEQDDHSYMPYTLLPGQGGEQNFYVDSVSLTGNDSYLIIAVLEHATITHSEFMDMWDAGDVQFNIDGMNLSKGNFNVDEFPGNNEASYIALDCPVNNLKYRLNSYRYLLSYKKGKINYNVQAVIGFDKAPSWEISCLSDWNSVLSIQDSEGNYIHQKSGENFTITGKVDFSDTTQGAQLDNGTPYFNLELGTLVGEGDEAGFYNLEYKTNDQGLSWIATIAEPIKNLTFDNITCNMKGSIEKLTYSGLIAIGKGAENCTFTNMNMYFDVNTGNNSGIFGKCLTNLIKNVTVDNLYVECQDTVSYMGGLAGIYYGYNTVTMTNIEMKVPNASNVGAFGGKKDTVNTTCNYITMDGVTIDGKAAVTGVAAVDSPGHHAQLKNLYITSKGTASGYGTGGSGSSNYLHISDSYISGKGDVGGLLYSSAHQGLSYVLVDNIVVHGTGNVGGVGAKRHTSSSYIAVVNSEIYNDSTTYSDSYSCGGLFGYNGYNSGSIAQVVVRNTYVKGPCNVGGIIGRLTILTSGISRAYVAEDVIVEATLKNAGGAVGLAPFAVVQNTVCGATVICEGENAGGIIGCANDGENPTNIDGCIFAGSVVAKSNAAGLIGYVSDTAIKYTNATAGNRISKVLIAATKIEATNGAASGWLNSSSVTGSGDGEVYVWDQMLVNNQSIKALYDAEVINGGMIFSRPESGGFVTAEDIATVSKLKTYVSYTAAAFDYGTNTPVSSDKKMLTKYFPYTVNTTNAEIPYAYYTLSSTGELANKDCGIPLPIETEDPAAPIVYPSGIATINIEIYENEKTTINVNGKNFLTDEHGILSLYYDFMTPLDITVDGVETKHFEPEEIERYTMVSGNYWYMIDADNNNQVAYANLNEHGGTLIDGTYTYVPFGSGLPAGEKIVHLWQGRALSSDGYAFNLSGPITPVKSMVATHTENGVAKADTVALLNYSIQASIATRFDLRVFYKETELIKVLGNAPSAPIYPSGELLYMNDRFYTSSTYQNRLPDGIVMCHPSGIASSYMIVLTNDGELKNVEKEANYPAGFKNSDIVEISANFCDSFHFPVMLVRYSDGTIVGVNYHTGIYLFGEPAAPTLLSKGMSMLKSIFKPSIAHESGFTDEQSGLGSINNKLGATYTTQPRTSFEVAIVDGDSKYFEPEEKDKEGTSEIKHFGIYLKSTEGDIAADGTNVSEFGITHKSDGSYNDVIDSDFFEDLPSAIVAYNPYSEEYEPYDMVDFALEGSDAISLEERVEYIETSEKVQKAIDKNKNGKFNPNSGILIELLETSNKGTVIGIALIASIVLILVVVYFLVVRKKDEK